MLRGLTKTSFEKERQAVGQAEKRWKEILQQRLRLERKQDRTEQRLLTVVRSRSIDATAKHGIKNEAIILAFRSEKNRRVRDMVPVVVDASWAEGLLENLWYFNEKEGWVYFVDAAGFPEPLHRRIKGASMCDVTFKNGNRLDCRRDNLVIHRNGFGDEHELRKMKFSTVRRRKNKKTGEIETITVRTVVLFEQYDLDAPEHENADGEKLSRYDYVSLHALRRPL